MDNTNPLMMSTEELEAFAPPAKTSQNPEEYWPTDEYGNRLPIAEWTVSDLGCFPDEHKEWLIKTLLKENHGKESPGVRLLKQLEPSQIAQDPRAANAIMAEIVQQMGITPTHE